MEGIFEGMPFDENVRSRLAEQYPEGEISVTRGRHYELEEDFPYLVRAGAHAVVMPRMAYGAEAARFVTEMYGKGEHLVGERDLSASCGDHS